MFLFSLISELECNESQIPMLENGGYELLSNDYRGTVVYRCATNELEGNPVVYCNETAQWSQLEATCEGKIYTTLVDSGVE